MKEKLRIDKKRCTYCSGLISWDKKIDGRFPTHVDQKGYIIDDGRCPSFKKPAQKTAPKISIFQTQKFNRFNQDEHDPTYTLPIYQGNDSLIPRFYIGKVSLDLHVYKKIIKVPKTHLQLSIWRLAHTLIRSFLEQKNIISFFRIIESDDGNEGFIHLYIVPISQFDTTDINSFILASLNKIDSAFIFPEDLIVNKEHSEELITTQNIDRYIKAIKTFFDALVYRMKYKIDEGEFKTSVYYDLIEDILYFYIDIDVVFYGKGSIATKEDIGKFIFGVLKDKNKKYRLIEITSTSVNSHLDTPEYLKFLEYSRNMFENKGFSRKKDANNDWTIKDYWEKINQIIIPDNGLITVVEGKNEKKLFFPLSRLFKNEKKDIPMEQRVEGIQVAKKELSVILEEYKTQLKTYSPIIEIIPLEQIIPKYFDLTENPIVIEFAEGKTVSIMRDINDCNKLDSIPQELLKNKSNIYKPIAGKFNFYIVPIIPDDLISREMDNVDRLINDIRSSFKAYNLSDNIQIGEYIQYKFNKQDIFNRKQSIWGTVFDKQIAPELKKINQIVSNEQSIIIPLIGLREMGTSSKLFKYYIQNEFYRLLKNDLSKLHFSVIQSFLVNEYKTYKGSKLAVMLYKNSLFNIAANCPQSYIAKRIQNGILFKFKYPFGTKDISHPIESIEMQAGFDASKVWGVEYSKPRGAVIVTLDPYGKQVRSKYIRDARTHKGLISESVMKDLILEILNHQDQLVDQGLQQDKKLPKKIIFLFDGNISNRQKELFIKVYKELIESGEYPTLPEFFIFEVLKSHPIRMYLVGESKIYNVPFGVMALLNEKEFVIKSHIWNKVSMAQPQLYRFKMRLSQRFKDIEHYTILDIQLVNIAVQLFQSTLFNTGKSGRPLKESFVIHESHKLSQEFASKSDSIGVLYYKD